MTGKKTIAKKKADPLKKLAPSVQTMQANILDQRCKETRNSCEACQCRGVKARKSAKANGWFCLVDTPWQTSNNDGFP